MAQTAAAARGPVRLLREELFSLNLGYGLALLTTFLLVRRSTLHLGMGYRDLFDRVLLRLDFRFYHSPVFGPFGIDVVLTGLTTIFFLPLWVASRHFTRGGADGVVLRLVSGVAALAAVPTSWAFSSPTHALMWMLALYYAVIGGALFLTRRRPNPAWFAVLAVHYSVCGYVILQADAPGGFEWPRHQMDLQSMWPYLASLVSPLAGFVWAFFVTRRPKEPTLQAT
jgi:hypothetical protein